MKLPTSDNPRVQSAITPLPRNARKTTSSGDLPSGNKIIYCPQPWASLIVSGVVDYVNRVTASGLKGSGRYVVYAKDFDDYFTSLLQKSKTLYSIYHNALMLGNISDDDKVTVDAYIGTVELEENKDGHYDVSNPKILRTPLDADKMKSMKDIFSLPCYTKTLHEVEYKNHVLSIHLGIEKWVSIRQDGIFYLFWDNHLDLIWKQVKNDIDNDELVCVSFHRGDEKLVYDVDNDNRSAIGRDLLRDDDYAGKSHTFEAFVVRVDELALNPGMTITGIPVISRKQKDTSSVCQPNPAAGYSKFGTVLSISEIECVSTREQVDAIVDYFVRKSIIMMQQYDIKIQRLLLHIPNLHEYYHRKMMAIFGKHGKLAPEGGEEQVKDDSIPQAGRSKTLITTDNVRGNFDATKTLTWILDWDCVLFRNGSFIIAPSAASHFQFSPMTIYDSNSKASYNYIKSYFKDRMSPIYCTIAGKKLIVNDEIKLKEAILHFSKAARQHVQKTNRNTSAKKTIVSRSFQQAISKARNMTVEQFKKYKSKYINHLLKLQSANYKIIPCTENLAHENNSVMEDAFIFTLESAYNRVLIVIENVNPDRSTLVFLVNKTYYMKAAEAIYSFLQSAEINKRSELRSNNITLHRAHVERYDSFNHIENDFFSWKHNISRYL